jgi:molybdopterin converting factor subunit 1
MRLRVRFFAIHRELLGRREEELELPEGATIAGAWSELTARHPALAPSRPIVRFARNLTYADPDESLSDGDELAIIPPVAGGAGTAPASEGRRRLALTAEPIDDALAADLARYVASDADGAIVTFVGRTRETPGEPAPGEEEAAARYRGQPVVALEYEAYEAMALSVLEAIAAETEDRFGVAGLAIVHRTGRIAVGEASVAIVAAAPHRDAAFDACRYAIEELKARAPIWKSEYFADGRVWLGSPARAAAEVSVSPTSESLAHATAAEER